MNIRKSPAILAFLGTGSILAGCANSAERFPSLAIRDFERVGGTFQPALPEPTDPAPANTQTLEQIDQLLANARQAHQQFLALVPPTRSAVDIAIESGPEDYDWSTAQLALADLDSRRSLAAIALGDLDLLYAQATLDFSERRRIDAAREQVIAMLREEDAMLADLDRARNKPRRPE